MRIELSGDDGSDLEKEESQSGVVAVSPVRRQPRGGRLSARPRGQAKSNRGAERARGGDVLQVELLSGSRRYQPLLPHHQSCRHPYKKREHRDRLYNVSSTSSRFALSPTRSTPSAAQAKAQMSWADDIDDDGEQAQLPSSCHPPQPSQMTLISTPPLARSHRRRPQSRGARRSQRRPRHRRVPHQPRRQARQGHSPCPPHHRQDDSQRCRS